MKRVVVTGLGIVSCIGNTKKEVVHNLKNLNSGIVKAPEYEEFSFRSLVHGKPNINLEENIYKFNEVTSFLFLGTSTWDTMFQEMLKESLLENPRPFFVSKTLYNLQ